MRNYEMNQYNYGQSTPYNNGNDRWSSRYPTGQQQRQQFFEARPLLSNNNGYYGSGPSQLMSAGNNYNNGRQPRFNSGNGGYANQQSNYGSHFNRAATNV
jgi:hypothetical protein